MNSREVFCPNPDCPARGCAGEGTIHIHARIPLRYRCTVCQKTFSARAGTPFYRRSTDEAIITLVVTLIANGCPPAAIEAAFGLQRQTVRDWLDAAGAQCARIHQHLICQPRDLGAVQADEIRVKQQGGIVWVALALMSTTRLWLGGAVSRRRDGALIARLCAARAAAGLGGRLRGVRPADQADGAFPRTARRAAGAVSAGRMAGLGDRADGQTTAGRAGRRRGAAAGARHARVGGADRGGRWRDWGVGCGWSARPTTSARRIAA
jgi:transposase-like protein